MMVVTTWTPERLKAALDLVRAVGFKEAARRLGKTDSALRSAFAHNGIEWREAPPPFEAAPPASAGVPVSAPVEGIDWRGARPKVSGTVERRLVIGDVHFPAHSASALACVYALARAIQPHRIVQVGDLVNSAAFSHHGAHSPEPERYDLAMMAARGFIRSLQRAAPGASIHVLRGNHDDWASRYEAENPGMQGTLDFEILLGTKTAADDDRPPMLAGVEVIRAPEENPLVLGPVAYAHGNGGGLHFAKRYAENNAPRTGVKIIRVGHHHTLQVYRHRNGCEAWGVGWIGNEQHPAFHYAPPPRAWWTGVIVEDVAGELVTTTPIPIVNGCAVFGGHTIAAAA